MCYKEYGVSVQSEVFVAPKVNKKRDAWGGTII